MILNVGSPDRRTKVIAPTKKTLKVMKQEMILEALDYCISVMKKHNVRVKIPLIITKALVLGNLCNENEGLGKMPMLLEECENLDNPADYSSCFSTNKMIAELESGLFNCSFLKVLIVKRKREVSYSNNFSQDKLVSGKKHKKNDNTFIHNQCMLVDV